MVFVVSSNGGVSKRGKAKGVCGKESGYICRLQRIRIGGRAVLLTLLKETCCGSLWYCTGPESALLLKASEERK